MEILGIGPAELILIFLIAFVVLGPERLPTVGRTLGRWVRQLSALSNEFTGQLKAELADTAQELQTAQAELRDLSSDLSEHLQADVAAAAQELGHVEQALTEPAISSQPVEANTPAHSETL